MGPVLDSLKQFTSPIFIAAALWNHGPQMAEVARLSREGDTEAAAAEDAVLHGLYDALFVTANPIPVKAALNILGHEVGGLRLPLVPATPEETAVVAAELRRLGLTGA